MTEFDDLSEEGRFQKLRQHLDTGHPVPARWVEWLLGRVGVPDGPVGSGELSPGFQGLAYEGRLASIRGLAARGKPVPTPWVAWVIESHGPVGLDGGVVPDPSDQPFEAAPRPGLREA